MNPRDTAMCERRQEPEAKPIPPGVRTVFILQWRYSDNSAFGIVGAYNTHQSADRDKHLLEDHGTNRVLSLIEIEVTP